LTNTICLNYSIEIYYSKIAGYVDHVFELEIKDTTDTARFASNLDLQAGN
jgi:hypothetical protein